MLGSLFYNVAGFQEISKIFKDTLFYRTLPVATSNIFCTTCNSTWMMSAEFHSVSCVAHTVSMNIICIVSMAMA